MAVTLADFQKTFAGVNQAWVSYGLKFDHDCYVNLRGMLRLPGLTNESCRTGASPFFANLTEISKPSAINTDIFRFYAATTDIDRLASDPLGPRNDWVNLYCRAGKEYWFDIGVIRNTGSGSTWNRDGQEKIYVNNSLMLNRTDLYLTTNDSIKIDCAQFIISALGTVPPAGDIHVELGGNIVISTVGPVGAMPKAGAAWLSSMPIGVLTDIPNTKPQDMTGAPEATGGMLAYSGVGFNAAACEILFPWGGGHRVPTMRHGLVARQRFNVDTPGPAAIISPITPLAECPPYLPTGAIHADFRGRPSPTHLYDKIHYIPQRNILFSPRQLNYYGDGPSGQYYPRSFNFTTMDFDPAWVYNGTLSQFQAGVNAWSLLPGAWQPFPQTLGNDVGASCKHPITSDIMEFSYGAPTPGYAWWRQTSGTWAQYGDVNGPYGGGFHCATCWDPIRNHIFAFPGATKVAKRLNMNNIVYNGGWTSPGNLTLTGMSASEPFSGDFGCASYNTDDNKIGVLANTGRIYQVDPVTGATVVLHGTNQADTTTGREGRLHYYSGAGGRGYFSVGLASENVRFLKLA